MAFINLWSRCETNNNRGNMAGKYSMNNQNDEKKAVANTIQAPSIKNQENIPTQNAANYGKRCMRAGPIQRNPYLNFLREFRQKFCGFSPIETMRKGAQAWKSLSEEQKCRFIVEAFYAPKRRKRKRSRKLNAGYQKGRTRKSGIGKRIYNVRR